MLVLKVYAVTVFYQMLQMIPAMDVPNARLSIVHSVTPVIFVPLRARIVGLGIIAGNQIVLRLG